MRKTAILSNVAADIPVELIDKYNIVTIQVPMEFPDTKEVLIYPEEIGEKNLLKRIHNDKKNPTPLQPSIDYFINTFKRLEEQGYNDLFIVNMTSRGTGIVNTVKASINQYKKLGGVCDFFQYDSREGSFGVGISVVKAAKSLEEGIPCRDIIPLLTNFKMNELTTTFTFENLKFLQRSGRISLIKYYMGSLLNIFPCLEGTKEGEINSFHQAKTYDEAVESIIVRAYNQMKHVDKLGCYIVSGNAEEGSKLAEHVLIEKFPEVRNYGVIPMSGVTYCFTGPGSVIVVMFKDFEH